MRFSDVFNQNFVRYFRILTLLESGIFGPRLICGESFEILDSALMDLFHPLKPLLKKETVNKVARITTLKPPRNLAKRTIKNASINSRKWLPNVSRKNAKERFII